MRVAQVGSIGGKRANGVHQVTTRLCEGLPTFGVESELWNFNRTTRIPTHDVLGGVERWRLPVIAAPGRGGSHLQLPTPKAARWMSGHRGTVDVLHLHSVFQPDHLVTSRLGIPFVVTPHGGHHPIRAATRSRRQKQLWMLLQEKAMLERAAVVHALTKQEERDILDIAPHARCIVLPTPIPQDLVTRPLGRYSPDGPIVFLGRLDISHKGLDRLVSLLANVDRRLLNRGVLLAGPGEASEIDRLRHLIFDVGLSDIVKMPGLFTGEDKFALLESASIFIQMSRHEGLPLAPLEAMAVGVPVVVSPGSNLGETVSLSGGGWEVDPEAIGAAEQLEGILNVSARARIEIAEAAQQWVRTELSWQTLGPRYVEMYQSATVGR